MEKEGEKEREKEEREMEREEEGHCGECVVFAESGESEESEEKRVVDFVERDIVEVQIFHWQISSFGLKVIEHKIGKL